MTKNKSKGKSKVYTGKELAPATVVPLEASTLSFWLGSLPGSPRGNPIAGGVNFPPPENPIIRNEHGQKVLGPPTPGSIRHLTRAQVESIAEALPSKVFRFSGKAKPGQPRPAAPITIPSKEMTEAYRKNGRHLGTYTPHSGDEPVARYVFFKHVPDGRRGHPDDGYPDSVEATGISLAPFDDIDEPKADDQQPELDTVKVADDER